MTARHGSATVTLPSDTEILITRFFEAPRHLVWDALTSPRHLLRWWGPHWCPMVSCDIDLRPGGTWRYLARDTDGNELAWRGTYLQIEAFERIVSTEMFEGFPDAESVNTMTLDDIDDIDGGTRLHTLVRHSTREFRDGHVQSGMESGMQETFNRLDDLMAASDTTSERFRRVAGRFTDRAAEVPVDGWDATTPCEGWTASHIVAHLVKWVPSVIGQSGVTFGPGPTPVSDPYGAWTNLAATLQTALDDPDTASREFDAGPPGRMTVENAIGMLVLGDVLIHTWDLARACGLDETLDPGIVADMLIGMQPIDDILRSSGHYGPKIPVSNDADDQTKLIAFTGRNPNHGRRTN